MLEQFVAVKLEVAVEMRPVDEQRQPVTIVRPHLVGGDFVYSCPEWDGLFGRARFTEKIEGDKNRAVQSVAVAKLEVQFSTRLCAKRPDVEFLKSFAQRG